MVNSPLLILTCTSSLMVSFNSLLDSFPSKGNFHISNRDSFHKANFLKDSFPNMVNFLRDNFHSRVNFLRDSFHSRVNFLRDSFHSKANFILDLVILLPNKDKINKKDLVMVSSNLNNSLVKEDSHIQDMDNTNILSLANMDSFLRVRDSFPSKANSILDLDILLLHSKINRKDLEQEVTKNLNNNSLDSQIQVLHKIPSLDSILSNRGDLDLSLDNTPDNSTHNLILNLVNNSQASLANLNKVNLASQCSLLHHPIRLLNLRNKMSQTVIQDQELVTRKLSLNSQ